MRTAGYGVTVVIPSFRGPDALAGTLRSLAAQTLAPDRFEVVAVINGPAASQRSSFEALREQFAPLTIRLIMTATAGASFAWNLGVQAARMEWLTFVDDDDAVTPGFLERLLEVAAPGVVPLTEIHDVRPDGTIDEDSTLNRRIREGAGTTVAAGRLPQGLGFNASKLIPTAWAKECRYNTAQSNGQDVAYFGTISLRHDITFAVPAASQDTAYLRTLSDTSMSRQEMSFDFSIEQRLDVIETLDRARRAAWPSRRGPADHLIGAQAHLMNRYLRAHPDQRPAILEAVRRRNLTHFPYSGLNRGLSTRLAIVAVDHEWAAVEAWARLSREPFDVLLIDEPGTAPRRRRPQLSEEIAELEGRVVWVEGPQPVGPTRPDDDVVRRAVAALESTSEVAATYRDIFSSEEPLAALVAAEICRRHPSVRCTTAQRRRRGALSRRFMAATSLGTRA